MPLRDVFDAMAPKKLVAVFDCNPNISPSAPISWKKLDWFMIVFALVFLMVMTRTIAVELVSAPGCLLVLLMMIVRSGNVTIWLYELPPGTGVGERMTIGTPWEPAFEVAIAADRSGCCD